MGQDADEQLRQIQQQREALIDQQNADDETRRHEDERRGKERERKAQEGALQHVDDVAKAHRDECAGTFAARLAKAQQEIPQFAPTKAKIQARCSTITPKCTLVGRISACRGVTDEEKDFFDNYCRSWPQVLAIDESEQCGDVDPIALEIYFSMSAKDLATISAAKLPAPSQASPP